jgi:hypothetical protein
MKNLSLKLVVCAFFLPLLFCKKTILAAVTTQESYSYQRLNPENQSEIAKIQQVLNSLAKIGKTLRPMDKARLTWIERDAIQLIEVLKKHSTGHALVLAGHLSLFTRYRRAGDFLSTILQDRTEIAIRELISITNQIETEKGLRLAYPKIIATNLRQMGDIILLFTEAVQAVELAQSRNGEVSENNPLLSQELVSIGLKVTKLSILAESREFDSPKVSKECFDLMNKIQDIFVAHRDMIHLSSTEKTSASYYYELLAIMEYLKEVSNPNR